MRAAVGMAEKIAWPRTAAAASCGAPAASSRPCSSTMRWSASGTASSSRCSDSRIVSPSSSLSLRSVCRKVLAAMGSSWLVGSSRMSTSGRMTTTDARLSICFWPPESAATSRSNQSAMPK